LKKVVSAAAGIAHGHPSSDNGIPNRASVMDIVSLSLQHGPFSRG
jgi:hypothetical protein